MNEQSTSAQVFLTVTTFSDQNDGSSGNGLSLRDAVLIAQSDPGKEYVISLVEGTYNLTLQGNEDFRFQEQGGTNLGLFDQIVTRTGDLDIETTIKIVGDSASNTIIDASLLGDRIFDVRDGGFLTLENVTIQNGTARGTFEEDSDETIDPESFAGGGIRVSLSGGAEINNSVVKDNRALWDGLTDEGNVQGGGLFSRGIVEINNTTVIGNFADSSAGGIFNSGTLEINSSSIVNNITNTTVIFVDQIEGGGGIQNSNGGTLLIRNSTISGNGTFISGDDGDEVFLDGAGGGGVLSDSSQTTIINSTIINNTAPNGAGILSTSATDSPGSVTLKNSIVADNNYPFDSQTTFSGDIEGFFDVNNSSFNLIGNGNGILIDGDKGNIVGNVFEPIDPLVTPLGFYGGSTPTHALFNGSPAINNGNNSIANQRTLDSEPLFTDQRGFDRIVDNIVDIGSYEFSTNEGIQGESSSSGILNTPIYRFQNNEVSGTYLYAAEQERQIINSNFNNFSEEGFAFNVAVEPGDDLIPMYRFQNSDLLGTYLYAGEQERQSILQNNPNFVEEGIAFYVYGVNSDRGSDIYRFQNVNVPGTYLFVGEQERQEVIANNPNFIEEGIAFEVAL